uniref:Transmembrane protein n=1 Tax=Panagrellus redivivus TaxID=6233 RepID=A0A7E4V5D0_PANRE
MSLKSALILAIVILTLSTLASTKTRDVHSTKAPKVSKNFPWWAIVVVVVIFLVVIIAVVILICVIRDNKQQRKDAEARQEVQHQLQLSRQHMSAKVRKNKPAASPAHSPHADEPPTVTATDPTNIG